MNVGKRPRAGTILIVTMLALATAATTADAADDLAGKWRGEVPGPQGSITQIIQFQQDPTGRWVGTTKLSVEPDKVYDLEAVNVDGQKVTFRRELGEGRQAATAAYALTLRPLTDELRGTLTLRAPAGGRQIDVTFSRVVERADAEGISYLAERPVVGSWAATPDGDDEDRQIQVDVLPSAEEHRGTITDTGIGETVAMRDLEVKDGNVLSFNFRFEGAPFMSSFWGRYDEAEDRIRGTMSVGGRSQAMDFERTSQGPDDVDDGFTTRKEPLPIKHDHRFALTGRLSYWQPLYVLKEDERNINDITTAALSYDGGLRFYIIDYLAVQARYVRGGLGFDTNEHNLGLFDPETGPQGEGLSAPLTTDSYLAMDGYQLSLVGYLGQNLFPESRFNPYLVGSVGRTDWELTEDGRGSDVIEIFENPVEGSDWTFGAGLGTEIALSDRLGLEAEWLWAYTTTEDETEWPDVRRNWTNQHVYRLSFGAILWF